MSSIPKERRKRRSLAFISPGYVLKNACERDLNLCPQSAPTEAYTGIEIAAILKRRTAFDLFLYTGSSYKNRETRGASQPLRGNVLVQLKKFQLFNQERNQNFAKEGAKNGKFL